MNDLTGNLIAAYEVPNYALLVQATKTGANHDALALVTAVDKGTISMATWAGHGFNSMQFRTSSGGLEVGSAILDAQGNVSVTGYWPYGSVGQGTGASILAALTPALPRKSSSTFAFRKQGLWV